MRRPPSKWSSQCSCSMNLCTLVFYEYRDAILNDSQQFLCFCFQEQQMWHLKSKEMLFRHNAYFQRSQYFDFIHNLKKCGLISFFTSTTVMTKYSSLKMFIVTYIVNHTLYMAHFFFLLNFVATTLTLPLFLSFFPFCFSFSPGRQYNSVNMTEGKTPLECRRVINIFLEELRHENICHSNVFYICGTP